MKYNFDTCMFNLLSLLIPPGPSCLNQVTWGVGIPVTLQIRVTLSFSCTEMSCVDMLSRIFAGTEKMKALKLNVIAKFGWKKKVRMIWKIWNVTLRHELGRVPPQTKATGEPKRPSGVKIFDFGILLHLASDRSYLSYLKRISINSHCK